MSGLDLYLLLIIGLTGYWLIETSKAETENTGRATPTAPADSRGSAPASGSVPTLPLPPDPLHVEPDPIAPARGCFFALLISVVGWIGIVLLAWTVWPK